VLLEEIVTEGFFFFSFGAMPIKGRKVQHLLVT
jgi:hypothetical protein